MPSVAHRKTIVDVGLQDVAVGDSAPLKPPRMLPMTVPAPADDQSKR